MILKFPFDFLLSSVCREDYEIHAGKNNPRLMGVVERTIADSRVLVHPNYKDPQQYFDVALIVLSEVVSITNTCIASFHDIAL